MHLLLLLTCVLPAKVAGTLTMGNFFLEQQFQDSNLMKDTETTSFLQESFHLCSLTEECDYVIKDTRNGVFSAKEKEGDLPDDKRNFRIWKKTKPVTYCDSNPCKNGGRCIPDDIASYSCICDVGYKGMTCEYATHCHSNPCRNGGKCLPDIASYSCVCSAGYTGRNCENAITCKSLKKDGRKSGTYNVLLPSGIFEVYCEMDINGGVYTFISKQTLSRIQQSDIDSIFTNNSHVLLRLLKPDNSQPYTIIQQYIETGGLSVQLNAFVNYTQPRNYATSGYLLLGLLPRKYSHQGQIEGLKSNGVDVTFNNCDGNPNNYFAFFSIKVAHAQDSASSNANSFDSKWRESAIFPNSSSIMSAEFFMFTELHFGGCGCYTESSRWPSSHNPANATAIGLQ